MKDACILVATNVVADAELVKELLRDDFSHVVVSTDPDKAVDDFDRNRPDVLILAFNSLEKAERYYLGLYRASTVVNAISHRTVILCGRSELQRVYELCRKAYFHDYVLFWPMTNDAQRLPMAVTHALRDLEHSRSVAPPVEVDIAKAKESQSDVFDLDETLQPFGQAVSEIDHPAAMHGLSMPTVKATTVTARSRVLVVDDDEFERKLIGELLKAGPYDLLFVSNGIKALELVREKRPDLILMDMVMPELNGLETLRRLKASPRFANIPVMMITGRSEKEVVVDCLKAGAVGFLVKPLDREVLLKKVAHFLTGSG